MFTGLIEEIGRIISLERRGVCARLVIEASRVCQETGVGDSISVDGVCLTVVRVEADRLTFDVMTQTLNKSTLKSARTGLKVNLERALKAGERIGGHLVSGHVDGVGVIRSRKFLRGQLTLQIGLPAVLLKYLVSQGSVAVDGVSLTIADKRGGGFTVCLIPQTSQATTLGSKGVGSAVNIEIDMVAKMFHQKGL